MQIKYKIQPTHELHKHPSATKHSPPINETPQEMVKMRAKTPSIKNKNKSNTIQKLKRGKQGLRTKR